MGTLEVKASHGTGHAAIACLCCRPESVDFRPDQEAALQTSLNSPSVLDPCCQLRKTALQGDTTRIVMSNFENLDPTNALCIAATSNVYEVGRAWQLVQQVVIWILLHTAAQVARL